MPRRHAGPEHAFEPCRTGSTTTSISLSWTASTDNVGVTGYGIYNGARGWPATTTHRHRPRCGTSYTLSVDAADAAGNRSAKAAITTSTSACADTQAPSTPSNLARTGSTTTSISLSWTASTDNVGVTGYGVYNGAATAGSGTATTYTVTGLVCGTSYTLSVDAADAAGNRSAKASVVTSTSACPADTTPPSLPTNQQVSSTQTTILMTWGAATDNVGIAGYRAWLNGAVAGTTTSLSYTYTGLQCGTTYTVALEAYDAAGNVSNRAMATGPVTTAACAGDTQAPTTPTNLARTGSTATSISLSWTASTDNVGVTGYRTYNGAATAGSGTATNYTVTGLTCGTSYTLSVDAADAAGNRSAKAAITTSTSACAGDTQAPTTPANFVPTSSTASSISLSWGASLDNVGVAGYGVYNGATSVGSGTWTTYTVTGLVCGTSYTLSVDAFDAAGNRSAKSTVVTSTAACAPPPPPPPPTGGTANIWVDANGGTCADSAGPVAYSDAAACSWAQANTTCEGGDTVLVKGGSYGNLTIRGSNGRSSACTFRTVAGETVTAGSFNLGEWQSCSRGASSTSTTNWFSLVGPIRTTEFHADCSNQVSG